jgi:large subunit ribosomal protein L40
MRRAIDLLQVTDERLFELSVGGKKFQNVVQKGESGNARLEGLVPREMRVPMERPGSVVWDGEWKAPVRKV